MICIHYSSWYERAVPFISRVLFAALFLSSAFAKIPGTGSRAMEVGMTAAAGVPFASLGVLLAFILEVVTSVMLIVGWQVRTAAFVLAFFTMLLTAIFHHSLSDQMAIGMFISHLGLIAGLLYMSVYGSQRVVVKADPLPR